MNKVILIGNLTKDPQLKTTHNGSAVCSFSLAINHGFGDKKEVDYIDCVAWKANAENLCKFMAKGKKIAVCGRIQKRKYEDTKGETRYITEVVADEIEFLSPMGEAKEKEMEPFDNKGVSVFTDEIEEIDSDSMPF